MRDNITHSLTHWPTFDFGTHRDILDTCDLEDISQSDEIWPTKLPKLYLFKLMAQESWVKTP